MSAALLLLAAAVVGQAGSTDLTSQRGPVIEVDAGQYELFGLRWHRWVVERGRKNPILATFGQPGVASASDTVVVGTAGGRVLGLATGRGEMRWEREIGRPFEAPVNILANDSGQQLALLTARDGTLYALSAVDGETRWQVELGAESRAPIHRAGDTLYVTTANNQLFALNAADGSTRGEAGRSRPKGLTVQGHAAATVDGKLLFTSYSDGYVEAYARESGTRLWSRPLSFGEADFVDADADPVRAGDKLFVASYADGVYALNPEDGQTEWNAPAPAVASLAVFEDLIIAGSADGWVWGLSQEDGSRVWRTQIPSGPISRLLVRKNLVVFSNGLTGLVVLDAHNGRPLQATPLGSRLSGDPGWGDDGKTLSVLSTEGRLFTLRLGAPGMVGR